MFIIIAGAGLVGSEITKMLVQNRHDVAVVDADRDVCENVYAETGAMAVHGTATRIQVLEQAGAAKADVLLCLMRNDADNIACALLAKSLGVGRIIARMRIPRYEQAYKLSGVTTIVRVADLLLNQILMEVEQPKVRKIMTLGGGKAQIYAVKVPEEARSVGRAVRDITQEGDFPDECLLMGIFREEEEDFIIPRGNYVLHGSDTVFLVSRGGEIKRVTDLLTRKR